MKKYLPILLLLCFTLSFPQEQIDGFRGWKWGTPLEYVESQLKKSSNKLPGFVAYEKINENLTYEGLKARLITYGFKKKKFKAVNIGLKNADLDKIVAIYTKKYGEPKKTETPFFTNWEWHISTADISVAYFPSKKEDGVTIGIKGK
jgi:hypothetical protein